MKKKLLILLLTLTLCFSTNNTLFAGVGTSPGGSRGSDSSGNWGCFFKF